LKKGGGSSVTIKEGERLRHGLNGRVYIVQAFRNNLVVLDAEADTSWIITEKDILGMFYTKIGTKVQEIGSGFSSTFLSASSEGA
jgi:hypothetical protein